MEIIVYMILVSLGLALSFLAAFWWANRGRQFDDLVSPAVRAVFDDENRKLKAKIDSTREGDKNG